jgi:endonuclease YncB( thermonuclease family)
MQTRASALAGIFLLVVCGLANAVAAKPVHDLLGRVTAVHDGDTLTLLVGRIQHKIRLNGIDAPELRQAFGRRARQFLSALAFGKTVTVHVVDVDRYGREVGDVYVNGALVNAELVRAGMAWHYKQYSKDATLAELEIEARAAKRGLWADSNPVPPWEYRGERRKARKGISYGSASRSLSTSTKARTA